MMEISSTATHVEPGLRSIIDKDSSLIEQIGIFLHLSLQGLKLDLPPSVLGGLPARGRLPIVKVSTFSHVWFGLVGDGCGYWVFGLRC